MRFPTTPMCDGALLAAFEPTTRDTDVFVATAAKAGQTWLLALLHHLRTRGRDPGFSGLGALGVTPWLELPWDPETAEPYDREARLADFAALPDPRIFKMHVPYDEIPRPAGSAAKVMTITRDPRDLPWSMYCHLLAMREAVRGPFVADFDAFFEGWLERGYIFRVVRSFWVRREDPDVLWLRYEDLHEDLPREARRCVAFLGWDLGEADLGRACALAGFGHMWSNEKDLRMGASFREDARFVRQGAVGRNRERLSVDQEARIVARARQELEPACVDFLFSERVGPLEP